MSWRASGLKAWLWQRLSAVYMALFLPAAGITALRPSGSGFGDWQALFRSTPVTLATGLFFLFLLLHAWIGLRDVILDYLRPPAARFTALALVATWLLGLGVWVVLVLTRAWA